MLLLSTDWFIQSSTHWNSGFNSLTKVHMSLRSFISKVELLVVNIHNKLIFVSGFNIFLWLVSRDSTKSWWWTFFYLLQTEHIESSLILHNSLLNYFLNTVSPQFHLISSLATSAKLILNFIILPTMPLGISCFYFFTSLWQCISILLHSVFLILYPTVF